MRVVWTPRARGDLRQIRDYLRPRNPAAATRILGRIIRRVSNQRRMRFAAPIERDRPERCLVVTRTPYLVLYTVDDRVLTVVKLRSRE